jgi:hypothetical protein
MFTPKSITILVYLLGGLAGLSIPTIIDARRPAPTTTSLLNKWEQEAQQQEDGKAASLKKIQNSATKNDYIIDITSTIGSIAVGFAMKYAFGDGSTATLAAIIANILLERSLQKILPIPPNTDERTRNFRIYIRIIGFLAGSVCAKKLYKYVTPH